MKIFSRLAHLPRMPTKRLRCYHHIQQKELCLIGVPFSGGQPRKGVEEGPEHLRKYGLVSGIKKLGYKVTDCGNLKIPLVNSENYKYNTSYTSVKNSVECGSVAEKLSREIAKYTKEGKLTLTLGGDHSVSVGTVFGHASVRKNMCLLWIDAHMDINTPLTTRSGNLHGMPLSMLIRGVPKFSPLPGYEWCTPCLCPQNVAYIGLRDVDPAEREISEKLGIAAYSIDDIDKVGIGEIMQRALERINPEGDRPIHVSYDIDSLDPKEAPSTGTRVKGGLTLDEGIYISQIVAQTGCLSAVDVVEFNPAIGTDEEVIRTASNTMKLITILLGQESHLKHAPLPPADEEKAGNGLAH